jgi:mRNA-degrading endonuclease RelE of RelBE toxin-antitoxin system
VAVENLLLASRNNSRAASRVIQAVTRYANGDGGDIKKLHGVAGEWRLRVGDLRVILTGDSLSGVVDILDVLNRRDAYD